MEIQSIYGGKKTAPAAQTSTDEDKAPASGFAALLDTVGSQFKGAFGLGAADPALFKKDADAEATRAAEPREAKQRPERSDDKDTKAKPAKDDADDADEQTEETAAADDTSSDGAETGAETQTGAQQAVSADVAAAVDPTLVAQAAVTTTVAATETVASATTEAVTAETDAAVTEVVAAETETQAVETVVDPKAVQQSDVKTAEKVVAPEAVVKDTARAQQTASVTTPTQNAQETAAVEVETETAAVETKAAGKDTAVRTDAARSATAQDQASNLARLLGAENRVQVQVTVNAAHTAKQSMPDVSIYNIYSGYSAADAISLANGQFGQAGDGNALTQPAPARNDGAAQAAVVAQAAQAAQPVSGANSNTQQAAPARAEGFSPSVVQASASSNGASNANMGFGAFTQGGASSGTGATQQAAQPNPTDRPAATAQQVIDQIKVNITKAAKAGLDRVTINLKPVELGRIEIKLEMSEDHKVRVTVTADNKDTLNLLQTDSRTLERTLNDAGLRTDSSNLSFNLRSDTDAGAADGQRGQGGNKNDGNAHAETANDNADQNYDYAAAAYARGGVDTFA